MEVVKVRRRVLSLMSALVCAGAAVTGAGSPAGAAEPDPETIPIDLILAGSYADPVRDAMRIWNTAVPGIKFVEQSTPASLRVKEYTTATGTGSHVFLDGAGRGWVYLETGDAKVYRPTRVAVHELGHTLSLADLGPGSPCSKVMSGGWAGPECVNTQPDAEEVAEVAAYFAGHDVGDQVPGWPPPSDEQGLSGDSRRPSDRTPGAPGRGPHRVGAVGPLRPDPNDGP
ncbi:snapalysin [Streptomyces sp. B3I7]|uniref:snapalysin family zinc-dependent metalloprotease n=1 Tax=Streptomyces sp. B3I7 TaxID=3042269 RepID=UPI00278B6B0E|nr:snapalysin family zinc-dependent metalloprotease [Streptomyces sp. B3I7]MDQ0811149.1 snapalysin [Streptomyces sp. B3I7]